MTTQIADLIGLTEISERWKVSKNTANGWTKRPDFPESVHRLAMGPMWDSKQVEAWRTPTNFPQELKLHCVHCQSRRVFLIKEAIPSGADATIEAQFRIDCTSCGQLSRLFVKSALDSATITTAKEAAQ